MVVSSNNDVNVLDQSLIYVDFLPAKALEAHFTVNGHEYKFGYYLTNLIHLAYSIFMKTFRLSMALIEENYSREPKKEYVRMCNVLLKF